MTGPSRFAIAKERLLQDLEAVIPEIFPGAKPRYRRRNGWNIASHWRGQSKPSQMIVWLSGSRRGGWKDFVTGEGGDAIDLIAWGKEGIVTADSRMRAVEWIEDRFGIRRMDPETRAKMAAEAARRRELAERQEARRLDLQRERVRRTFFACEPNIAGTPVETYLGTRGIRLSEVPHLTHSFRYRADCEYWPLARYDGEGNRLAPGPTFPALVSAMVSSGGKLCGLHLTFLAPDGRGKAPVKQIDPELNEKLFKGDVAGLVIRVTNGPSGLAAEAAAQAGVSGPVGLTEGIEDALSAAIAAPGLRMWAAGSLSGLLHVPDHPCASSWLVFRDNDWGKPAAARLFDRALARLRGFGKPVQDVAMPADWGKDVNDAINA